MNVNFDDLQFMAATGAALASAATGDPKIAVGAEAGLRLLDIARKAYESGRERGEWTPAQAAAFDAELERVTAQDHWKKK